MIKKKAFTLAEVLITLGVIGVVAAMTLPTLIQKYKRVVVETQLRREYALIANAVKWAEVDNGTGFQIGAGNFDETNDVNGFGYEHSEAVFEQYFKKYFKIVYTYNRNESSAKFRYQGQEGGLRSISHAKCVKIIDGTALCYIAAGNSDTMGYFYVFLEPEKEVKIAGRDVFSFEFNRTGGTYKLYSRLDDHYNESQRNEVINACTAPSEYWGIWPRPMTCTFLIWKNNFNIPDDYPIKF